MTKSIKLLSLCTAIGVVTYGSAVYLFNDNAQKILDRTFEQIDSKSPLQSIKERFEIKAYKFQVNFLNADKTAQLLNVQYNPLFSNAHLNYVSAIEEKITIEEGKEFSVKFDLEKPTYFMSVKLPRYLNKYKKISDLLFDENFYITDMNQDTGKRTCTFSVAQVGLDIPEMTDIFPISMKMESDIRTVQFKRDGNNVTFGGDFSYQMDILMGKRPAQMIKGSADSTLTINTQSIIAAVLKAEKAGKMDNCTPEQKEDIANDVVNFLKNFKVNYKITEAHTPGFLFDNAVHKTVVNNMENDRFSMAYNITGISISEGRRATLKEILSDKTTSNKMLSATDAQFDVKSQEAKEKSAQELENFLLKTVAAGDDFDFSAHLNLDFKSKGDKIFLDSGKKLVQAVESLQFPGEYELGVDIGTAIGENFALTVGGMLFYKDATPHADLKITFNENAHKALMDFVQSLTNAAKGTSFQQSANEVFATMKSLPYDMFFQPEKNPTTDKQERVFKVQF